MGNLSAFLAQNVVRPKNEKYVASERFLNKDGKPMEWELRCVTTLEEEQLRKSSVRPATGSGRHRTEAETDYNTYAAKLTAACTVFPNLNDAELQNSYSVLGAEELLKVMLTPGEYAALVRKVQEINGFNRSIDEDIEDAKN